MSVFIISHDAGGAEILSEWYRKHQDSCTINCCLEGPALKIFERSHKNIPIKDIDYISSLSEKDWVLTGTSLESNLERNAIQKACELGIRCVSFLDHWDLYEPRFEKENEEFVLPDEIWVGDKYGYQKALDCGFGKTTVKLQENPYFEYIKQQASAYEGKPSSGILYICETIGKKHEESAGMEHGFDDEFAIMENLLKGLASLNYDEKLVLRLHPRESKNKYDELINKYRDQVAIRISEGNSLIEDIMKAEAVVGMESMGLIVAMLLNKKAFSYRTGRKWQLSLPFPEIIQTDSVSDVMSAVNSK